MTIDDKEYARLTAIESAAKVWFAVRDRERGASIIGKRDVIAQCRAESMRALDALSDAVGRKPVVS